MPPLLKPYCYTLLCGATRTRKHNSTNARHRNHYIQGRTCVRYAQWKDTDRFIRQRGDRLLATSGNRHVLAFSTDPNAKLVSVKAGQQKVDVERTALSLRELVEGNIGARVTVTEVPGNISDKYEATILDIPSCSGEELESRSEPYSGDKLRQKGNVVLLKTQSGVKVVNLNRIQDIRFADDFSTTVADEEFRNMLTLNMTWKGEPGKEADVGLIYLRVGFGGYRATRLTSTERDARQCASKLLS